MEGETGFAGNRLHGTQRSGVEWRKLGGSLFGGEKGQRPSVPHHCNRISRLERAYPGEISPAARRIVTRMRGNPERGSVELAAPAE